MQTKQLIDGALVAGEGAVEPILDPATGRRIAEVPEAGPSQVNAAVADEAEQARTWCVRADDASGSTAWTPAGGRVGDTSVAVLTGDPRRSAAIRDAITTALQAGTISARHHRSRAADERHAGGGPGDPGLITVRGR